MARTTKQKIGKFLQVRSGAVYAWSPALAKAPGSFVVNAQVAADWFRTLGSTNHITDAYPPLDEQVEVAEDEDETPAVEATKGPIKKGRSPKAKMVMSADPATPAELQDMIDGNNG
jgi:hypothetical protein